MIGIRLRFPKAVTGLWCITCACATIAAAAAPEAAPDAVVFARVGDTTISRQDYETAVAAAVRSKFYHGKAPEADVLKLRREFGEKLVDSALLRKEAQRRKIVADAAAVKKQIDAQDARYTNNPQWQARRAELLPALTRKLEEDSVVEQLETTVRNVPPPSARDVDDYYAANPEKFTAPEQVKLSLILLKVDPSSPRAKWEATREEAAALVKQLAAEADFAQLARKHSGDESAARGGELGYLHRGMLPPDAQEALDRVKPVAVTEPVVLLEGVAVFRLEDRKPAALQTLADARARAAELVRREQGEAAWHALIAKLRKDTPTLIDESVYASEAAVANAGASGRAAGR